MLCELVVFYGMNVGIERCHLTYLLSSKVEAFLNVWSNDVQCEVLCAKNHKISVSTAFTGKSSQRSVCSFLQKTVQYHFLLRTINGPIAEVVKSYLS